MKYTRLENLSISNLIFLAIGFVETQEHSKHSKQRTNNEGSDDRSSKSSRAKSIRGAIRFTYYCNIGQNRTGSC
eukprot:m.21357 g.21357  ORF g.21357 m.21357 type:complete len:74 (-) comp7123_c0_seq1:1876-2097(-)